MDILMIDQLRRMSEGVDCGISVLANAAALLYDTLPDLNWAGFYGMRRGELVLGPFVGHPACVRIAVGRGVCGTAVQRGETVRVEDVHAFPGHIACDAASRSEIVIPFRIDGEIAGVLDIDSPTVGRFTPDDQKLLENFVAALEEALAACK